MSIIQMQIRLQNFNKLKDHPKLRRCAGPAFLEIAGSIREELAKNTPVGATVGLRDGWVVRGTEEAVKIINTRRYTKAVDMGRRAAPIPVKDALIRWVWLKLAPRTERQARNIAYVISKKARERDKPGQNFVRPTLARILPEKRIQAKQMVAQALREFING